jgi:hypothetical protein
VWGRGRGTSTVPNRAGTRRAGVSAKSLASQHSSVWSSRAFLSGPGGSMTKPSRRAEAVRGADAELIMVHRVPGLPGAARWPTRCPNGPSGPGSAARAGPR